MTTRENIGLLIVGVLGCTLVLQRCNKPTTVKGPAQITYAAQGNEIVIKHKDKKTGKIITQDIYEPDPGSTTITTDAHGNVTVHVRQFGVGLQPGFGVGYTGKVRLALDARVVYFKRFGINTGVGFSINPSDYKSHSSLLDIADPYIGVSYVPTLKAPDTSVLAGFTADKHMIVMLRFKF